MTTTTSHRGAYRVTAGPAGLAVAPHPAGPAPSPLPGNVAGGVTHATRVHAPDGVLCVHGNPNLLTADAPSSRLSQGCTGRHALVQVEPYRGDPAPPLATLPRLQTAVGEIEARLCAAEVLVRGLAAGDPEASARAPIAKLVGARAAIDSVQEAAALIGNNALNRRNPLERHLRDVLCAHIHTPQDDTILAQAGKNALGRHVAQKESP